jgi:CheY-like chemotaxis protein
LVLPGTANSQASAGTESTSWITELESTAQDADAGQLLSLGSPRVLLVDDAIINRKLQAKWLKKMGVPQDNVFHAANGEQAVACIWQAWCSGNPTAAAAAGFNIKDMREQMEAKASASGGNRRLHKWIPGPIDIVILDMGMEPGNGYSVVRELRRQFLGLLLVAAGEHAAATALVQPISAGTISPNGFVFPDVMSSTVVAGVAAPVAHFFDFPAWTCVPPLPRSVRIDSAVTSRHTTASREFSADESRHGSSALLHSTQCSVAPSVGMSSPQVHMSGTQANQASHAKSDIEISRSFKYPVFGNARSQPSEQHILDILCPTEGTASFPAVVRTTLRAVGHPYLIANTGNIDDQERCLGTLGMDGFLNKEADMGRENFNSAMLEAARWWRDNARTRSATQTPDYQLEALAGAGSAGAFSVAGIVAQLKSSLMLV